MKKTLQVIETMQADGVIGEYAIGGAVAATFYLEPVATLDLDVFITVQPQADSPIVSLSPIYEYLARLGWQPEGEHVMIAGWLVQFLPPAGPLEAEAVAEAVETKVDEVRTRVMTAEHLVAIALKTGRIKDKLRIAQFLESNVVDRPRLEQILARHRLVEKWRQFVEKYWTQP